MKLGMGMMRLPVTGDNDTKSIDYEQVNKMVDTYMDAGFNHFDTAYIYHGGIGEIAFKKAVAERYPRESYKIATKLPLFIITEESQLEPIFNEQLENCEKSMGRTPYSPRSMLKLVVYAKTNHMVSSEEIEDFALYHDVYKYVCDYITPSARSIRRFKKDLSMFIMKY